MNNFVGCIIIGILLLLIRKCIVKFNTIRLDSIKNDIRTLDEFFSHIESMIFNIFDKIENSTDMNKQEVDVYMRRVEYYECILAYITNIISSKRYYKITTKKGTIYPWVWNIIPKKLMKGDIYRVFIYELNKFRKVKCNTEEI